ncbi:MAG: CotH kinase family protein [Proteiniphilum sp.]|uniref:CotH kinase family protein n=1 Tax=Proteiniphilum sp. TaxID=1926877 RepID=UPI002ABAE1DF|nr:CotH kinase family protein [Proteiniphilum sp.]MDY9918564.1 CotH kinase family protein [Proteiniphilum sp.]
MIYLHAKEKREQIKSVKTYTAGIILLYFALFSFFISCSDNRTEELSSISQLDSFTFHPKFNEDLEETVSVMRSGTDITVSIPYSVSPDGLIATFTYSGASVKIGDVEQVSDVTKNDFSEPVVYSVIAEDGTKTDYTVTVIKNLPRIPRVYVNTTGGAPILDKENYVNSTVRVEDIDKYYTDGDPVTSTAGIRGRGNSTWGMDKKPYRVKLDNKVSLLGMSNDKDWALLANHTDKTLLRNITAFEIAKIAEMSWTPASISVDFYLNGTYQGVYALTEHVKVSKERLDMELVGDSDNEGEALTGGYFLELDFHYDEPKKFRTNKIYPKLNDGLPIMFKDPDNPTDAQFDYVRDYFNTAERVLYSDNFRDPENGYRKYIDVESFIKYYIVQELAKNVDGNMRGSCYMAIRRNGKIEMPLVWDFDIAFGNADHITWEQGATSAGPDGWFIKTQSPWFDQLFKDPYFVAELKKRWNELKPGLDEIPGFIRDHALALQDAQKKNFSPKPGGAGWSITKPEWNTKIIRGSYAAEVNFFVDFVEKRLQWLDTNINGL